MPVRIYPGGQALSGSFLRKLNARLTAKHSGTIVSARYYHFVDCDADFTQSEELVLGALLDYAPASEEITSGSPCFAIPRLGTISPWSSKATEIFRVCGLTTVRRIERGIEYRIEGVERLKPELLLMLHDPMTETILADVKEIAQLFQSSEPQPLETVDFQNDGVSILRDANARYGLALSEADIAYLHQAYEKIGKYPTDAELMMFAQVNSEHCRHKIFNASWTIDGKPIERSLFDMIRNTFEVSPEGVLSAYQDNAAVMQAGRYSRMAVDPESRLWKSSDGEYGIVIKVETHNHPTGISPFPGAATGSGGEIRDETACGRGGRPKAGLCGFTVSNLNLSNWIQPWERPERGHSPRMARPLDIMIEGPIGAASFNNEFGRPCLSGYFRTLEMEVPSSSGRRTYGYHKPIMIAGGLGSIQAGHIHKQTIPEGAAIVVLGGPAMLIGLGGGAASSQHTGASHEELDFASVQRSNPEMQRRAQEVIEQCVAHGEKNPILSIHDVGAGGLSNAIPELVDGKPGGAELELRDIPCADSGMSPREIWCNEAQERYVLAIRPESLDDFAKICQRERSPYAVVGYATDAGRLRLSDRMLKNVVIDMPLSVLFGESANLHLDIKSTTKTATPFDSVGIVFEEAVDRVLAMPSVGSKAFLITIGDRSVGGLTVRDQMIGPWQVPVADAAVTASDFQGFSGEAMSMGERPMLAIHQPAASARMAVAEALTNMASVKVRNRQRICLSANWMAASSDTESLQGLRAAVETVGMEFCPQLGIVIPVGKDSLSMQAAWGDQRVLSPVSLVISAFAPVDHVRRHITPQLRDEESTSLLLIALDEQRRLGGSALAQAYAQVGSDTPDVEDAQQLAAFFDLVQALLEEDQLLAYHDRSDGGLWACLCECAFAARLGLSLDIPTDEKDVLSYLFNEEIGAVVQVRDAEVETICRRFEQVGLVCERIGEIQQSPELSLHCQGHHVRTWSLTDLHQLWSRTSYEIARRRDNEECARSEYEESRTWGRPPLFAEVSFDPCENPAALHVGVGAKPVVAILREQGVNGQVEMAAAFAQAGFECRDVCMNDLQASPELLEDTVGLAACGGFSYGDVLGAGGGWAKNILFHNKLRDLFQRFFERPDVFALGVCNGCQMMSQLKDIIPGAECWPRFVKNSSEQFEARLSQVEILESPSILLQGMAGSRVPIVVAHGEGCADFSDEKQRLNVSACLRFVDAHGEATEHYPHNPNGSAGGLTAFTNTDGRFTIMMPHPERVFRTVQHSWHPSEWSDEAPWLRLFRNARAWVA